MNIIEETEKDFATFIGTKYAMLLNSGTSALYCAYRAIDIKDKEVIVPAYTYYATANMVLAAGGIPVFCDINPLTYLMDTTKLLSLQNEKTAAIVFVNLFGQEPSNEDIKNLNLGCPIIIDSAQRCAPNVNYYDIQCFSFYRTKNISTFEGGAVTTRNENLMKQMRIIANQGEDKKYKPVEIGFNFRISDLQALMLSHQIKYHQVGANAELCRWGPKNGHYPYVVYDTPLYKKLGYYNTYKGMCPVAEALAEEVREKYWK